MCNIANHGNGFEWAKKNFNRRIGAGVTDGSLKGYEIGMAGQANRHYQQDLARAKSDGVINPWERASLASERCAVSHQIYELRHNNFGNLPGGGRPAIDPCPTPWTTSVGPQPAIDPILNPWTTSVGPRPSIDPISTSNLGSQPFTDPFHPFGTR
ncbi:hypothetical protein JST97_24645 [bacterium]|nr:hypothetical protein [bacterium]